MPLTVSYKLYFFGIKCANGNNWRKQMWDEIWGNSVDVMQSKETLSLELAGLKFKHLIELEREIIEGIYHTGIGAVVQAIASKEVSQL